MKPRLPRPTDAELAILRVLWERGPSTVRQVHESLSGQRVIGYTTILKLMQIMADKGLVARDETDRTHIYARAKKRGAHSAAAAAGPAGPRLRRLRTEARHAGALDEEELAGGACADPASCSTRAKGGRDELAMEFRD